MNRRDFINASLYGASTTLLSSATERIQPTPHHDAKAKGMIILHMAGSPSHLDLFDYKPELKKWDNRECPEEFLKGKRFAFISKEAKPKLLGPQAAFEQVGQSGNWVSERLPHFKTIVDDVTMIKGMHTEQFNHAPAQFLMYTGFPFLGRPSMGAWLAYGSGSDNHNLPAYCVLTSGPTNPSAGKSIWGSGFLPSQYQGVQLRNQGEPVLYSSNPNGMNRERRGKSIAVINQLNQMHYQRLNDPNTFARMQQYDLAYRMQATVPEVMDLNLEPSALREAYGIEIGKKSFANNCLLARRLIESGVKVVHLFDTGWDSHGTNADTDLTIGFVKKCREIDQPIAALIKDLKQRGLLDQTLVLWGGEFGRTPMRENRGGKTMSNIGRDHHKDAFTMWVAGGGFKAGTIYGQTDEMGYNVVDQAVSVFDLQATLLHQMGFNHEHLTYFFQGRDYRLTDVFGHVVKNLIV